MSRHAYDEFIIVWKGMLLFAVARVFCADVLKSLLFSLSALRCFVVATGIIIEANLLVELIYPYLLIVKRQHTDACSSKLNYHASEK